MNETYLIGYLLNLVSVLLNLGIELFLSFLNERNNKLFKKFNSEIKNSFYPFFKSKRRVDHSIPTQSTQTHTVTVTHCCPICVRSAHTHDLYQFGAVNTAPSINWALSQMRIRNADRPLNSATPAAHATLLRSCSTCATFCVYVRKLHVSHRSMCTASLPVLHSSAD